MPRVAIVGGTEALRAALAAALRQHDAFEVVSATASERDAATTADLVLEARTVEQPRMLRPVERDTVAGPLLSNREREILALLADGLGNKQIAARLGISTNTVKTHLELLFEKLGASSRAEAVALGVRRGLLLL